MFMGLLCKRVCEHVHVHVCVCSHKQHARIAMRLTLLLPIQQALHVGFTVSDLCNQATISSGQHTMQHSPCDVIFTQSISWEEAHYLFQCDGGK